MEATRGDNDDGMFPQMAVEASSPERVVDVVDVIYTFSLLWSLG